MLLILSCVVFMHVVFTSIRHLLNVRAGAVPSWNDDRTAKEHFLDLLAKAKRDMVIYDDGDDDSSGSIYNDGEVLKAVKDKLENNSALKIRCCFNCGPPKKFLEFAQSNSERITVKTMDYTPKDRPYDPHYKIIDRKKAYLSQHALGSAARQFRIVDCTGIRSRLARRFVAQSLLGRYMNDFAAKFKHARQPIADASAS